jgi:hypothetical protein
VDGYPAGASGCPLEGSAARSGPRVCNGVCNRPGHNLTRSGTAWHDRGLMVRVLQDPSRNPPRTAENRPLGGDLDFAADECATECAMGRLEPGEPRSGRGRSAVGPWHDLAQPGTTWHGQARHRGVRWALDRGRDPARTCRTHPGRWRLHGAACSPDRAAGGIPGAVGAECASGATARPGGRPRAPNTTAGGRRFANPRARGRRYATRRRGTLWRRCSSAHGWTVARR